MTTDVFAMSLLSRASLSFGLYFGGFTRRLYKDESMEMRLNDKNPLAAPRIDLIDESESVKCSQIFHVLI